MSALGFLLAWVSGYHWPDFDDGHGLGSYFWGNIVAMELAAFWGIVSGLLWSTLIKDGNSLSVFRTVILLLPSLAFIGYATLWLLMYLLLALGLR